MLIDRGFIVGPHDAYAMAAEDVLWNALGEEERPPFTALRTERQTLLVPGHT